ncbi:ribosomal RNA processing protein 1 homolog [Daphnia carinata]|uniref:ribosomal RNA processing protein 1 homolog n=1 Tax=Daphnia carinata TaxID=120202 RepID=UPI00257DEBFE|nr:ribosomal RNA processing protein 1 homolog [Daphnia carinata]
MAVSTKTRGKSQNDPKLKIENAAKRMTPEVYFARKLASNEKKIRDRSLKKLRRWIAARSTVPDAFSEDELMKLWKGLFYCMWMSDKPLIQEDLAETISGLVHSIVDRMTAPRFITAALKTMARDWSGIDTWRMDKFLMFVRRIIRHSLEYLAQGGWKKEEVNSYSKMLSEVIINANESTAVLNVPIGLQLHVTNLFPEELAKAGGEELSSSTILKMFEPFAKCLATSNDYRLKKDVHQHVFTYLIKQSDQALEYEELGLEKQAIISMSDAKANRRKAKKFKKNHAVIVQNEEKEEEINPHSEIDEDEDADDGESENEDDMEMEESNFDWGAKDPRAGGVDAIIPQIQPDYNQIADMLFQMASEKSVRAKNRKSIYDIVKKFRDLASGIYPLAVNFATVGPGLTPRCMKSAAKQFIRDELSMTEQRNADRMEMRKSSKAYKKLQGIKTDIFSEPIEDVFEGEADEAVVDEEGRDVADLVDDDVENEDSDPELDTSDEDNPSDEEDEISDDEEDEISDDEEDEISDDEEDEISDDEADEKKVVVAPKQIAKEAPKSKRPKMTFEVENNWEEEAVLPPASMQQLKQKLKAGKRQKNSGWTESPTKGEIEIVIPNKKFKGSHQLQSTQTTSENKKTNSSTNGGKRRVNFVLNKNTAQEPKDYQESLRKSPGVPHDPDRQPSGGGVLKRNDINTIKLASSPVTRKPQRTGRKVF